MCIPASLTIETTDTDKVLQIFFDCAAAGPDLCAFYEPTAAEISDRLSALTSSIRAKPVPVITATSYGIVDYSFLRSTLFSSLYTPYSSFPPLAQGLAALEGGNGTLLYSLSEEAPFQCDCSNPVPFHMNVDEAGTAIQCGDAAKVTDSIEQLTAFYENAAKTSQFAEFFPNSNRFSCEYGGLALLLIHVILIMSVVGRSIGRIVSRVRWLRPTPASRSCCLPLARVRSTNPSLFILTTLLVDPIAPKAA